MGHRREHGRLVRVYELWCYTTTSTRVQAFASAGTDGSIRFAVTASVTAGPTDLFQPVEVTIRDPRSGLALGTFSQRAFVTCTIALTVRGHVETFAGIDDPPYPACRLGPVSKTTADPTTLSAFYEGIGGYAESQSWEWSL